MRIMVTESEELGTSEVIEIVDIGYNPYIYDDDSGRSGLYFVGSDNYYYYIEGVSKEECNDICEFLLCKGYWELTDLGEYQVWED